MSEVPARREVNVAEAIGKERSWLYACMICNGYNPCDHLFWQCYKPDVPFSERAWAIISEALVDRFGATYMIPEELP